MTIEPTITTTVQPLALQSDITLPGFYVAQIVDVVASFGIDTGGWASELGLEPIAEDLDSVTMPWDVFYRMVQQAEEYSGDKAVGLMVGQRLAVNTHGILGFAAMNSGSIRQVVDLLARFIPLRTDLITVVGEVYGQHYRIVFQERRELDDIRRSVLEALVLAIKNILDFIAMGEKLDLQIALPYPVHRYADFLRSMFNTPVDFAQDWVGISLPLDIVDRPLKMANNASFREAINICQQDLEQLENQDSLATQIQQLLLSGSQQFPTLETTARCFYMTPRTLHRRLKEEGTSYKFLVEDVRHRLALQHFKKGNLTIQQVAYALGYSDVANFRRAFKRWQGVPPSEYIESLKPD
ncbi:MAG: AraC family transcriptional regulator [Saccharospirillaceae bacterium]|nr:AraC family transcriptional regulator [Saccharospirillaceae bacterium]